MIFSVEENAYSGKSSLECIQFHEFLKTSEDFPQIWKIRRHIIQATLPLKIVGRQSLSNTNSLNLHDHNETEH